MTDLDTFTVGAVIIKGRVHVLERDAFDLRLAELADGLCVDVTIASDDATPSPRAQQKRYWWAVVVPICARHFQTTDRQMSRDLLSEHFGFEWSVFEQLVPVKASLSTVSADEMSALLEWVRGPFADKYELEIPVPDKDWRRR
jgi:hypothetical protein